MNKVLKVILGIVAAIVLLVGAVFYFTAGLVETADAFFAAVKRGDMATARSFLSEDFKANTDEAALREFLAKTTLANFKESHWSDREISNGRGEMHGSITTESGGSVPLTIVLVKEDGAWKIYNMKKPSAGASIADGTDTVPGKAEQLALAKLTMHDFAATVHGGSMAHFRGTTSQLWQRQFPLEKFEDAFKSAYTMRAVFDAIGDTDPEITPATALGEHGELLIRGRFPTAPDSVEFDAKYVHEGVAWKLIGFHFKI